ncbi:MAG: PD-(D/E)XK nuclease domain-containing protein [Bacteroidota bacterium]
MFQYLIAGFSYSQHTQSTPIILQLRRALLDNTCEKIIILLNSLFSSIPYHIFIKDREAYYHSLVFLLFRYLGQYIEAEVNTSNGRVDSVVTTDNYIYILEFKLDESADAAIEQIKQKNYAAKYQNQDKTIVGLGINFSSETKSVADWKQINL